MANSDPYAILSKYYDQAMGDRKKEVVLLKQLIQDHHPFAKTILELACGTGSLLQPLSRRYQVTGIDQSAPMLAQAKRKLPGVPLFLQHLPTFRLPQSFDVIFCTFNSLNHVLSFDGWRQTITQTAKHLNPLGIFIFEINTLRRLGKDPDDYGLVKSFGPHFISMSTTRHTPVGSTLKLNIFEAKGKRRYHLTPVYIREVSFPPARIKQALRAWFSTIHLFDPDRHRPSLLSERLYFVCHKRSLPGGPSSP